MARTKKGSFVKCASTDEFLEIGVDKVYTLRLGTTVEAKNMKGEAINRYVHLEVNLNHDSALKVIQLLNPKRVKWEEWIPPTEEDKTKYGDKARGKNISYDGAI